MNVTLSPRQAATCHVRQHFRFRTAATLLIMLVALPTFATTNDTQENNLEALVAMALQQHPAILAERAMGNAAQEDLHAAQLQRYPSLSMQSDTSGTSPSVISARYTVWDGGRTEAGIRAARSNTLVRGAQMQEIEQQLALRVIDAWQGLQQAHGRMQVIAATQQKYSQFFALMQRRVKALVSPAIELELVAARNSQITVEMVQAEGAARAAQNRLNVLLGQAYAADYLLGPLNQQEQVARIETDLARTGSPLAAEAVDHLPSVIKARFQAQVAKEQANAERAGRLPEAYVVLQKQIGNANTLNPQTKSVFFGLQYAPGAGFSSSARSRSADSRAESAAQGVDQAERDARDTMQQEIVELGNSRGRIIALEQSFTSTQLIMESYQRQFVASRRSWQEVLNAARENHDVGINLADTRASVVGSAYRLRVRMNDPFWQSSLKKKASQ